MLGNLGLECLWVWEGVCRACCVSLAMSEILGFLLHQGVVWLGAKEAEHRIRKQGGICVCGWVGVPVSPWPQGGPS